MARGGPNHSILDSAGYFLRFRNPGVVHFAITNKCDSRCSTCRFWTHDEPRFVDLDDARSAIDVLHDSGVRLVSITGGEPLLHPHLPDFCHHITRRGMMVSYLPTNGRNVTEEGARELARAGVNIIGMSVDPLHHDMAHRTRDVDPARVREARETLEGQGLRTYAGVLLTDHMLPLGACVDRVVGMGFRRIVFSYPQTGAQAPYMASGPHPMLALGPEYVEAAVAQIKRLRRSVPIYNPDATLDDLVRFYRGVPQRVQCLGGDRIFYLDWDLRLHKCFAEPESIGHLLDMDGLPSRGGRCTKCTQQAFRDMSYLLQAFDRFHPIADGPSPGSEGRSSGMGWGAGLMGDLKALFQLYIGGFV